MKAQCDKMAIVPKYYDPNSAAIKARSIQEIDELYAHLVDLEAKMTQMNNSQETLNKRFMELNEMRHVLRETSFFFESVIPFLISLCCLLESSEFI